MGLLWTCRPNCGSAWSFRDRRPYCVICSASDFHGLVTAVTVDVHTCKGLLVGVTLHACDGDRMVPWQDTPRRQVLSTAGGHHIVACVQRFPNLGSVCVEHSSIM